MQVRAQQHDTLDLLCWRHLGTTATVFEQALLLNPGLAEYGPFIPHGHLVFLPQPPVSSTHTAQSVQLWD